MRTFFASLVGLIAVAIVLLALVFGIGPFASWKERTAGFADFVRGDEPRRRAVEAAREAARARDEKRRAKREVDELQEQRRERLTLLSATLGVAPVGSVTQAEKRLLQQAERSRAVSFARSQQRPMVQLRQPVQIDEWTVLHAGMAVEFVHYDRDDVATIWHDGARYRVGSHQITRP